MRNKFFAAVAAAAALVALAEPSALAARSTGAVNEKAAACLAKRALREGCR